MCSFVTRFTKLLGIAAVLVVLGASSAQAAIAYGTSSFKTGTAAGSGAVTEPSGAASGDVLIALVGTSGSASALTRPAGWTNIVNGTSQNFAFDYDISYIIRGGSAPSLTWTWTGSVYYEVHIIRVTGADGTTPLDAQSSLLSINGARGTTQALSDIDPPTVTAVSANTLAVAVAAHWQGSSASLWAPPTGYSLRSDNTVGNDGMIATKVLSASGAEDPNEFFCTLNTPNDIIAITLTLAEAAGGGGGGTTKKMMTLGVGL